MRRCAYRKQLDLETLVCTNGSNLPRTKCQILSTLMFAVSSSRRKNALLSRERFRMAATEQGRRHDHQNDG